MNVAEYLRKFLNEQPEQEAAIPGLGVFYIGLQDGKKQILFKEVPPVDKAFLNYYAFEENLGEDEAKAEIEKWVRKILGDLKGNGNVWIEHVGAFDITSGKVVFTPVSGETVAQTENFGLETPAPANTVTPAPEPRPEPDPISVEEPKPQVPVNDRPRPNAQRRPLNPPVKRPQPASQPTSSGKEIILGNRKNPANRAPRPKQKPVYTQWWFILICVIVVAAAVVFGIKPVREKVCGVFKAQTTQMQTPQKTAEELLDDFIENDIENQEDDLDFKFSDKTDAEHDRQLAEENAEIARQVKAGQEQKKQQEAQVKNARQPQTVAKTTEKPAVKAQPKAEPKPVAKPAAKPASKPASKPVAKASSDAQKPVAGKCYIIVGSFSVEANADKVCKEMCSNGYGAAKLYIESKNLYYVSVKTCANRDEALKERAAFRDKGVDCWIFAN